jgi:predicted HicB family RNase H-like nuclease
MSNTLRYKGYVANVTLDEDDEILCGTVVNIGDTIHFEGKTIPELKRAFKESVEDYIRFCQERGEQPQKPYSGNFRLRLSPRIHSEVDQAARILGVSLNTFIATVVESEAKRTVKTSSTAKRKSAK